MIDGVLLPTPQYKSSKVVEVAKHLTPCALLSSGFVIVMSKDRFASLPKSAQEYISAISQEVGASFEGAWVDYLGEKDLADMKRDNGLIIHEFSDEEKARWVEKVLPMNSKWEEKMRAKGINPDEIMAIVDTWAKFYSDPKNIIAEQEKGQNGVLKGMYPPK